ncbi:MAG: hypothetical protein JWO52_7523 [Gammaproteobacteria bacterium]|nr:hypothetical protein [Gammaproteobacteria bacterium]
MSKKAQTRTRLGVPSFITTSMVGDADAVILLNMHVERQRHFPGLQLVADLVEVLDERRYAGALQLAVGDHLAIVGPHLADFTLGHRLGAPQERVEPLIHAFGDAPGRRGFD